MSRATFFYQIASDKRTHLMDLNDEALINGCIAGDPRSQKALYDRYASKMLGVCMRYAVDESEAYDMLQDGFIKVFGKMKAFENTGSFEGWVRRTMVNTCLDHLRKNKNRKYQVDIDEVNDLQLDQPTAIDKMNAEVLIGMLRYLPDGYRTVFNLFAIEGYSHKEIAEQLGVSENTSKSQFRKARLQLQQLLEKHGIKRHA